MPRAAYCVVTVVPSERSSNPIDCGLAPAPTAIAAATPSAAATPPTTDRVRPLTTRTYSSRRGAAEIRQVAT